MNITEILETKPRLLYCVMVIIIHVFDIVIASSINITIVIWSEAIKIAENTMDFQSVLLTDSKRERRRPTRTLNLLRHNDKD